MKDSSKLLSKKNLIVAALVVSALSVSAFALNVNNFTDYNPPDYLYLNWGDYIYGTGDSMAMNNAPSANPRETADYPYRSIFYGNTGSNLNDARMFVVYSKEPATSLFTFQYLGSDKSGKSGRIRASVSKIRVNHSDPIYGDEILIHGPFGNGFDAATGVVVGFQDYTNFIATTPSQGTSGTQVYFNFDFFYDCASEHQQGAHDLNMNGITSIGSVPYGYIIHCKDHTGYTGGGGDNGGGSSGGSSSGGSDSGASVSDGGFFDSDRDNSIYPFEDGSKTPDYSKGSSIAPGSVSGSEGSNGEKGNTWTLPEYFVPDLSWLLDGLKIPPMPDFSLPEVPTPDFTLPEAPTPSFNFPALPDMPDVNIPVVPYDPGDSSWPPPFPDIPDAD